MSFLLDFHLNRFSPSIETRKKKKKRCIHDFKSSTQLFHLKKLFLVFFHGVSGTIKLKEKIWHRTFFLSWSYSLFLVTQNLLSCPQEPVTEYSLYSSPKQYSPYPHCFANVIDIKALLYSEVSGLDSIYDISWPFKTIVGFFS